MKSLAFFAAAAIILASCNAGSASSGNNTTNTVAPAEQALATKPKIINSQEAKLLLTKQQNIVLLDVRTPDEYNAGHLKHATHLDFYSADFKQRLEPLDRTKTYVVYCAVGGRSQEAVQLMGQLDFKQVYDASEGFNNLKKAGIPAE